jgi:FMN reductase
VTRAALTIEGKPDVIAVQLVGMPPGHPGPGRPGGGTGPADRDRVMSTAADAGSGTAKRIAVVVGNPKPSSRTLGAAVAVAGTLAEATGAPPDHLVIDLAEHAASLFDWAAPELSRLTAEVAAADLAVFASPTYKASYTGMLKAFLDRYGSNGLASLVAVPLMTGGWPGHLLAVEVHLRPVLVELGAVVPARGLYITEPEFGDLDAAVAKWAGPGLPHIRAALHEQRM